MENSIEIEQSPDKVNSSGSVPQMWSIQKFSHLWSVMLISILVFVIYAIYLLAAVKLSAQIALLDAFYTAAFFAGLVYALPWSSKFIEFNKSNILYFIITHLSGAVLISSLWTGIHYYVFIKSFARPEELAFYNNIVIWRFIIGVLVYLIIQVFVYMLLYYDKVLEKTKHETELKNLLTEAELKTLKFQINPHFIFNSLNSIAALTSIEPEKAREMTIMLADFLRSTLSTNLRQTVPLREEIRQLNLYAQIEKIRFGDKFTYDENVDVSLLESPVPNMIMQPLLENAIKYGVYEALEAIEIHLIVSKADGFLLLTMENDFEDDCSQRKQKGNGVGLSNIKSRLTLLFGRNDLLKITKENSKFRVILALPLDNNS